MSSKLDILTELKDAVINGDPEASKKAIDEALESEVEPMVAMKSCLEGMNIVGEKFGNGDMFLTEVMFAADAMKVAMEKLKQKFTAKELVQTNLGKVVIGTVKGDVHDIGKNIVATLLEAAGFEVFDIGIDAAPTTFIEKAEEINADIIGASALLTSTKPYLEDIALLLQEEPLRGRFKFIVGGAPVTQAYADEIKADGYAENAQEAVQLAKRMLQK